MTRLLAVLPRPAVLVATEGEPKPMVVDAWVALGAAARRGRLPAG